MFGSAGLKSVLEGFKTDLMVEVRETVNLLKAKGFDGEKEGERQEQENNEEKQNFPSIYEHFMFDGKFWHLPKSFSFPERSTLTNGWKLWLVGMKGHYQKPIRPFRLLEPKFIQNKKLKNQLKLHWRPIFSMMEEGLDGTPPHPNNITAEYLLQSEKRALTI